jgi:hypothetical protein
MAGLSTSVLVDPPVLRAVPTRVVGVPVMYLAAHAVLGPVFAHWSAVSSLHAWFTLVVTAMWAAFSPKLEKIIAGAAYVAMCDVLWRGTFARFFYEGAKYAVAGAMVLAVVRFARTSQRSLLPLVYLGLLVPSILLTVAATGIGGARDPLSFNLSGPLTLGACALFFVQIRCSWQELRRLFFVMLGPVTALASAATYVLLTHNIDFTSETTRLASVGRYAKSFGANQVSAALGLGTLICLLMLLRERDNLARAVEVVVGLWCFGMAVLTFSRGGLYALGVAGAVALLLQFGRGGGHAKTFAILGVMVVAGLVVFSRLDTFTGGALDRRFAETGTTGRAQIAQTDLHIWMDHFVAGVGPGQSPKFRSGELEGVAAHTEFTRLLAEHGLLGLLAIACLLALAVRAVLTAPTAWSRTVSIALVLWAVMDMGHNAMRLAAPGFVFGLAMVRITSTAPESAPPPTSA